MLRSDVQKKSRQDFRASFVTHLSATNDWHISRNFHLLSAARRGRERVIKLTIRRDVCVQSEARLFTGGSHELEKGKCQLLSGDGTAVLH